MGLRRNRSAVSITTVSMRAHPLLESELRDHLHDGAVDDSEQQLRVNAQQEHQSDGREHNHALSEGQVGQVRPFFIERSVKDALLTALWDA